MKRIWITGLTIAGITVPATAMTLFAKRLPGVAFQPMRPLDV